MSRAKNAADIDKTLLKRAITGNARRPESSFDRRRQENAVNPALGVLCSLCGRVTELSLRRRAVDI
jgi:hypothetical protein